MSTFNTGDRVEFNCAYDNGIEKGDTGTIGACEDDSPALIQVHLDNGDKTWCFPHRLAALKTSPAPHVFAVGDKGKTKGGDSYKVLAITEGRTYNVITLIAEQLTEHTVDGSYLNNSRRSSVNDLLPPVKTRTVYANVFESSVTTYETAAAARFYASRLALHVALPVTFELPC